jgi:hypothetical protein
MSYVCLVQHIFRSHWYLVNLHFLFLHDQVIIQDSENKLQKFVYILNQMSKDYNLKISTDKIKIVAFKGKRLVLSKIEIDGSILEQVKKLPYFSIDNAHLMCNAYPKPFRHSF